MHLAGEIFIFENMKHPIFQCLERRSGLFLFLFVIYSPQLFSDGVKDRQDYVHGLHLMGEGQYARAIAAFQEMIRLDGYAERACIKIVESYKWNRNLDEGLVYYKGLAEQKPGNPFVHHGLGLIYKEKIEYPKALEEFRRTMQLVPDYGRVYQDFGDVFNQIKNLDAASKELTDMIKTNQKRAAVWYGLAYVRQLQKRWDEALDNADRAIRLDPGLLNAFQVKAVVFFYTGRYRDLLEISKAGLGNAERAADVEAQCLFLGNIGLAHYNLSNFPEALDHCRRALAVAGEIGDRTEQLRNTGNMGVAYRDMGKSTEALQCFQKSVETSRKIGDRRREGLALQNIGSVHEFVTSDYGKAREFYFMALPIILETGDRNAEALILWSLGTVFWYQGDQGRASEYLNQAFEKAEAVGDRALMVGSLGFMGLVNWNLGQYSQALDYYDRALVLTRETGNKYQEGIQLGNMAIVFQELGDYPKALDYYHQAMQIAIQIGDKTGEGRHLGNIGVVNHLLGQTDKALDCYRKAMDIEREAGNRKHEADFLGNYGELLLGMGKYADAEIRIRSALRLALEIGDKGCAGNQYLVLGNLYSKLGNSVEALSYYRKSLALGKKILEPVLAWESDLGIASTYERLGRYGVSLEHYRSAILQIEDVRETLQEENYRTGFMQNKYGAYEKIIGLLSKMHERNPRQGYDAESFRYAEMSKARVLLDILHRGKIFQNMDGIPDDFRARILENGGLLQKKYQELSEALNAGESIQNRTRAAGLEKEIETLQNGGDRLLGQLKQQSPDYFSLTHPRLLSEAETRNEILADNQVLLEYIIGDSASYLWILTQRSMDFQKIRMGRRNLETALAGISPIFVKDKERPDAAIDHRWANFNAGRLEALYRILVKEPAGKYLAGDAELIIVPDDLLYYFPFELLVTGTRGNQTHYLAESHPISYSCSASLMNPGIGRKRNAPKNLLAFGNPSFGAARGSGIPGMSGLLNRLKSVLRGARFEALPNAEREVRAIAANFDDPTVYTGKDATEGRLKAEASGYRIIHLATHFMTSENQPMQSKIALAQTGEGAEDGFLRMYEVYNLKLNADLTVLSGCSTGLGKLSRGEGLIGMSRAFLHAGVPSIVASLWPVDDESTALFMGRFYLCLKNGMSRTRALQQAKIALIESKDLKRDPFYWAPFILIGDWKKMDLN